MSDELTRDELGRMLPGHSLNPKGKPKGALSTAGKLCAALGAELPAILETLVAKAKAGDIHACRIILDRVLPPLRAEASTINLPGILGTQGLLAKAQTVLEAAAKGEITPDTASDMLAALGGLAKLKETDELEKRLAALEGNQ